MAKAVSVAKKQLDTAIRQLEKLGWKMSNETTKSRIVSVTLLTKNAKGYISIRYDAKADKSAVVAELYGSTKTKLKGIGGELHLIEITPRHNMQTFAGLNLKKCYQQFADITALLVQGTIIMREMARF